MWSDFIAKNGGFRPLGVECTCHLVTVSRKTNSSRSPCYCREAPQGLQPSYLDSLGKLKESFGFAELPRVGDLAALPKARICEKNTNFVGKVLPFSKYHLPCQAGIESFNLQKGEKGSKATPGMLLSLPMSNLENAQELSNQTRACSSCMELLLYYKFGLAILVSNQLPFQKVQTQPRG